MKKSALSFLKRLERRFAFQARVVVTITGLTGFYMTWFLNAWSRYVDPAYWWMHLMTFVWFIFTLVLFVLEPAFFASLVQRTSDQGFRECF